LFDPNINAIVAQQCGDDQRRRDAAYRTIFIAMNVGAMLGPLICGYVALRMNARYGFVVGSLFSLLSFFSFRSARRGFANSAAREQEKAIANSPGTDRPASNARGWRGSQILVLAMLGLLGIVFWAVYDQLGSSVTLLVERYVRRTFWSFETPAGYVQSINPFLVIILGPLFSLLINKSSGAQKRQGQSGALVLGLLLLGAGFGLLALGCRQVGNANAQHSVDWSWIWGAILLATLGELLFFPRSMSLAAELAPAGRRALVFGAWAATAGLGAYLSGTMAGFMNDFGRLSTFFGISAVVCFAMGLVFVISVPTVKGSRLIAI
jgi:POT family proton-dependent oligopeptide transporter